MKKTLLLIATCTAFSSAAHAGETDLVLMGKSWHFGHDTPPGQAGYDVNQYNWGGGLEYRIQPLGSRHTFFAGGMTYRDSFRQQAYTIYGGYQYTVPLTEHLSAFAAIRAGYLNGSGWRGPGALPSVGMTYRKVSVEATYIPPAKNGYNCVAVFARVAF